LRRRFLESRKQRMALGAAITRDRATAIPIGTREHTMKHPVVAVIAGLAVWVIVTTTAGAIMRAAWPDYAAVADAMTFTLPMMLARLSIGGLATLAAGWVAAVVSRRSALAAATIGLTLLVL